MGGITEKAELKKSKNVWILIRVLNISYFSSCFTTKIGFLIRAMKMGMKLKAKCRVAAYWPKGLRLESRSNLTPGASILCILSQQQSETNSSIMNNSFDCLNLKHARIEIYLWVLVLDGQAKSLFHKKYG